MDYSNVQCVNISSITHAQKCECDTQPSARVEVPQVLVWSEYDISSMKKAELSTSANSAPTAEKCPSASTSGNPSFVPVLVQAHVDPIHCTQIGCFQHPVTPFIMVHFLCKIVVLDDPFSCYFISVSHARKLTRVY